MDYLFSCLSRCCESFCYILYPISVTVHHCLFSGYVGGEPSCTSSSLNTESRLASLLPTDNNNNDNSDVSVRDEDDPASTASVCESGITDKERCEAVLAAMDASTVHSSHQLRPGLALSVEACLARFTDKEILSGANMITCETCSRAAAATAACINNDDINDSPVSSDDHSLSSPKYSVTGAFNFVVM